MTKRFSLLALVLILTIAAVAPVRAAGPEEDLAAVKARIASLEQQIRSSSGKRSAVAEEVLAARARLEKAEGEVVDAQAAVDALRADLAARQEVLAGIRAELASRLIEMAETRANRDGARSEAEASVVQAYMHGGTEEPSIAFSAKGIVDISVGLGYLDTLTSNSSDAADRYAEVLSQEELDRARVQQLEGSINAEVQALEESERAAEVAASELAIKRAALDNEYRAQADLLARVEAQIAAYEHEKDGFEKEEASIRATIAAAAAAAKAKAEAEARAAAAAAAPAAKSSASATSTGNGTLRWPIQGRITSPFGWRIHPITWTRRLHTGIDIDGWYGQEIKAAKAGTVILAGVKGGFGNAVMIDHGNGWVTLYAHQQSLNVQVGQYVTTNTTIGFIGSTGDSTGPHLHFELRVNGVPTDPMRYL